jgi:arylsulfatase A-like enzyme
VTGLLLASALGGCRAAADPQPRLVLLFAPCTVNAKRLSPYDESVGFTPELRAFAKRSVVFARHQTETPQSGPAYASIFSGAQADHHQVYRNPSRLPDDVYVIAESFAENGYETFYWIGHPAASVKTNFHQGIQAGNIVNGHLTASAPRFDEILERLALDEGYKAFVITTPVLTHSPYRTEPWEAFHQRYPHAANGIGREKATRLAELYRANFHLLTWNFDVGAQQLGLSGERLEELVRAVELLYASTLSELDQVFGDLVAAIDARGLEDASLIAFTADHGEVMYRPNALFKWSHGLQLAPEALNVPLIIRAPGLGAGRYEGVTRSIDVFPTLAGLSGISIPPEHGVQGEDLSGALLGREPAPRLVAPSHTAVLVETVFKQMYQPRWKRGWAVARGLFPRVDVNLIWVSIRDGDTVYKSKKVGGDRWGNQVFDLAADPAERIDLHDPANPRHSEMAASLASYKARLVGKSSQSAGGDPSQLPEEKEAELLKGLGYIR